VVHFHQFYLFSVGGGVFYTIIIPFIKKKKIKELADLFFTNKFRKKKQYIYFKFLIFQ